jgi:hypothetical protein
LSKAAALQNLLTVLRANLELSLSYNAAWRQSFLLRAAGIDLQSFRDGIVAHEENCCQ